MKNIYLFVVALAVFSSSMLNAQDYNKWSWGLNVGGHYGSTPTTTGFKTLNISHSSVNGRYMTNNRFGVMLDFGTDRFISENKNLKIKTNYLRGSFQGVFNLTDILMFDTWTKHIGLSAHAGFGISYLFNSKDARNINANAGEKDWMANAIIGIRPQFKLSERVSLNLDLSYITHVRQDWDFDMLNANNPVAFENQLINWSVGATFNIGKNSKHVDWTYTERFDESASNNQEERIKKLEEQLADNDGDGVFNYKDEEPDTPQGNLVDDKGVTIVKDPIVEEVVPTKEEQAIIDAQNENENQDPFANAKKEGNFEFDSNTLNTNFKDRLSAIAVLMKENPAYNLRIEGHTDITGPAQYNQKLSEQRAKRVYDYLIANGIDASRLTMVGYGESKPLVPSTSAANLAKNRRVELKFFKK
jgi:OOP family OmpA-OmpF porin